MPLALHDTGPAAAADGGTGRVRPPHPACPRCCSHPAAEDTLGVPGPITAALALSSSLTARETDAFALLGLGCDNRTIARTLSISERTAKRHVTAILAKLGLESRLQAGLVALLAALGGPPP